jgi:hypothetical protein
LQCIALLDRSQAGYLWIQGTKPQTLAYGLTDSPVGLAAWIVEKFRSWSDCGGEIERCFTKQNEIAPRMVKLPALLPPSALQAYAAYCGDARQYGQQ